MSDVVVTLAVHEGEEDRLFGQYISSFIEGHGEDVARFAEECDAPFLMVRSDPALGEAVRIVTFQAVELASAFSAGWRDALRRLSL